MLFQVTSSIYRTRSFNKVEEDPGKQVQRKDPNPDRISDFLPDTYSHPPANITPPPKVTLL